MSTDSWAVEYLLACSASKLKHLTIQLRLKHLSSNSSSKLFGCTHAGPSLRRLLIERLEQPLTHLPPLYSLVLVIVLGRYGGITDNNLSTTIHFATMILEHVNRDHLMNVRVEFKADSLARLGARISEVSASLKACKQLETALLTFSKAAALVHDPVYYRRVGRAKFWSPIIRRAFPRLADRGLLTTPCEWRLVSH